MKSIAYRITLIVLSLGLMWTGCKKEKTDLTQKLPSISNIEIGLGNNQIGVIGEDFHFNADIEAGERIDLVQIKIQQQNGEAYAAVWSHEINWEQYKGARNTNIHKHFTIPVEAVEGKYDFLIIVTDENGTRLEEKHTLQLYKPENLPVDLRFDFGIDAVDDNFNNIRVQYNLQTIFDSVLYKGAEPISKDEFLVPVVSLAGVKGDGKLYCLIINKKHNHRPETIAAIDFSKVVVADVWEHKALVQTAFASNMFDFSTSPLSIIYPSIKIGAAQDKNAPSPNPVSGSKAWESGSYYVGFVYYNSTYNMGVYHYGDITVKMN